ncbi:RNA polymerase sigma factor [Symbioplanes lichenis]|uniref:RNA polymerase sigma factor n=1 Tax=Symbioplanes lichenis TaxID=1629072 RepID=UPI002739C52F|nr:sigma-70 family RNA polymerase sigma factor [Actinoplanes lichenis]
MSVRAAVAQAHRESYAQVVATLIRVTGDWDLAEDATQDALATALDRWRTSGIPDNPGGWLMTVARNRALDIVRRRNTEQRKLAELANLPEEPQSPGQDDRLRLIFTCCHPALSLEARVALTLRTVTGMSAADIARVFLVSESTMTRRLTRAKTKIAQARIPYQIPAGPDLAERLPSVLGVLYLLFTRGYDPGGPSEFAAEAIRLARLLDRLIPGEPEVRGLLALFLLQHSRRSARLDEQGRPIVLTEQDRSRWDHAAIGEALAVLPPPDIAGVRPAPPATHGNRRSDVGAGSRERAADVSAEECRWVADGPYAIQAAIAACHVAHETDWVRVADLYDRLALLLPSPVVRLNRALAHGYAHSPARGLALLAEARAGGGLDGYAPALAVAADLTSRAGDPVAAAQLYESAAAAAATDGERSVLLARARSLSE